MIKCSFCGHEFSKEQAVLSCRGCALHSSCGKQKCPRCGYEMLKEPEIFTWFKRWKEGKRYVG